MPGLAMEDVITFTRSSTTVYREAATKEGSSQLLLGAASQRWDTLINGFTSGLRAGGGGGGSEEGGGCP